MNPMEARVPPFRAAYAPADEELAARFLSSAPARPEAEARIARFAELVSLAIANAEARTEVARLADEQGALQTDNHRPSLTREPAFRDDGDIQFPGVQFQFAQVCNQRTKTD